MRKLLIPFFICLVVLFCSGMIIVRNFPGSGGSPSPDPTDQFSGDPVQSVGVTATSLFSTGTVTISGNIATFSSAFPTNVGVGDCIVYGSNYAIIKGINSDRTKAYVTTKDGSSTPASASGSSFNIYRSFTSLADWESQTQNTNITPTISLTDFDLTDTDDEDGPLYVACYADGNDTTIVTIDGWTTDSNDYIKIFTPVDSNMVGTSQRHSGTLASTGYGLIVSSNYNYALTISDDDIRLEGLKIENQADTNAGAIDYNNAGELQISYCIIRAAPPSSSARHCIDLMNMAGGTFKLWNSVIYDGYYGVRFDFGTAGNTFILYNNTFIDCNTTGIRITDSADDATVYLKNNIVQGTDTNYNISSFSTYEHSNNISEDATSPDSSYQNLSVAFSDETNDDFHLSSSDAAAKDAGIDLSSDAQLSFSDDIDGDSRTGTWDIGADEN